jgi:two-component system sensor histidine kinase VicK
VTVDDSGFGIEDVDAERIFMPFFRTQDARRKRIDGVGLGMTIARSMIEIHQGKIWAVPRSIAGCGRIVFTLPVARAVTPHG